MAQNDTLERTAIVAYTLMQELHRVLADPETPDDISLGIVLGTAMFCDDKVGPFRTQRLLRQAPDIVLEFDAHVTDAQATQFAPVLQAFGEYLQQLAAPQEAKPVTQAVTAA